MPLWQWGVIVALAAWVLVVSSASQAGVGAAASLIVAGLWRLLITQRVKRGVVSQRGGMALTNLVFLGATLAVATLLASWHGRQAGPRLLETTLEDIPPAGSSSSVNPMDAARLEIAMQCDPAGIAQAAARVINRQLRPSYVALVERIPEGRMFVPLSEVINDPNLAGLGHRLAGTTDSVLSKGTALWMLDDADDTFTVTCRRMGIHAALIVPLEHLSRRVGAIQIAWTDALGPATLAEALSFSSELARLITPDLAIAQFSAEIERGYFDAIASLAARVDDRDEFTRGHSRRVAKHALAIAEVLNLGDDQQRKLLYAAELHDIGRIGVSEDILSKPGALTPDEWAQVRTYRAYRPISSSRCRSPPTFVRWCCTRTSVGTARAIRISFAAWISLYSRAFLRWRTLSTP